MAQNKPLFVPWLRQQIDGGRYPGVYWVNQEHTRFSIPWKHALRQDSNNDDILIFKAWAQTSTSPNRQIQGEPSVWKRNFRSALRARGFLLEDDKKNDTANPHKVFKWPEECQEMSQEYNNTVTFLENSLYLEQDELLPDGCQPSDLLEHCLRELDIGGNRAVQIPGPVNQPCYVEEHGSGEKYHNAGDSFDAQSPMNATDFENRFSSQETTNMNKPHYFSPSQGGMVNSVSSESSNAEGAMALGQLSPLEGAFLGTQPHTPDAGLQILMPVQTDSGCVSLTTHYNVKIYYKGKKVLEQLIQNEAGFQIVPRTEPNQMAGELTVVKLPETECILDQTQVRLTQDILNNLRGLQVKREGFMLLSFRWGESRVYWGLDKHEQGSPRQLAKNNPQPIYSLKDFISGLVAFMQNGGKSPSYSLFFFLGQQWPDPKNKPWEKKLIMVEVTLTALEGLKSMALDTGASSMQSSELQISLEHMMEMF